MHTVLVLWVGFVVLASGAVADSPVVLPETAPAQRLAEILEVVNAGERPAVVQYALDHFTPGMLKPDVDSIVDFLMGQYDAHGGYDLRRVLQSSDEQISVLVQGRRQTDRWVRLVVGAEAQEPHRVQGLFTYAASAALQAQSDAAVAASELPEAFAKLVDAFADAGDFSGSVCLGKDGKTLLSRAWGEADRQAHIDNTTGTRFNMASLGKMFTAVAIMQLVDSGRLSTADVVSSYIPDWLAPESKDITVKQLLTHTSGLGDYLQTAMQDPSGKYDSLEDYRPIVMHDAPAFEPGSQFRYSNSGYLLLGVLIEKVSGKPWEEYVQKHIFEPAGMRRTSAYRPQEANAVAIGYFQDAGGRWQSNADLLVGRGTPAGGSASTAEDLMAFATALRAGRLLTPESLDEMTQAHALMQGTGMHYGYGFTVSRSDKVKGTYGHTGGFPGVSAMFEVYQASGYVLAVLANQGDAANEVANAWRDLLRRSQP